MQKAEFVNRLLPEVVKAIGEGPLFKPGDRVRISTRYPVGHYRVPRYVRGCQGIIESIIVPTAIDNEEEGFGLNAGMKLHYYRLAIPIKALWSGYSGAPSDGLRIEVYETWLERVEPNQ